MATAIDWRTLPAGRELDALVAEQRMGATWRSYGEFAVGGRMRLLTFETSGQPADGNERNAGAHMDVPRYSASIGAAWRILGTLRGDVAQWDAFTAALSIVLSDMHATALHELADSQAALAICRAALVATMEHAA